MPLYEYVCPSGHITEALLSLKDNTNKPRECACGRKASRVLSATRTNFVFADTHRRSRGGNRK